MLKYAVPRTFLTLTLMAFTCFGQNLPVQEPTTKPAEQVQEPAGNQEVIDLLKSGMSAGVIIAKIKASTAKFDSSPTALQTLKSAGAVDEVILALIEVSSPRKEEAPPASSKRRVTDELTTTFKELQMSVVTIWSEFGHGTGFIFDERGLVMTNQHVIGPSELVSVQFDQKLRVPARILG